MLLDTSTVQNLRYVSELLDGSFLTDEDGEMLLRRHGHVLGRELVALGTLLPEFRQSGSAWLVSETSLIEFERATGGKGRKLLDWWAEWADYVQSCGEADWYPEVEVKRLVVWRTQDVHPDQLTFPLDLLTSPLAPKAAPAFGPFRDPGDRAVIRDAIRAGIPSILTTDIKSFWRHRAHLRPFGISVFRPSELVNAFPLDPA